MRYLLPLLLTTCLIQCQPKKTADTTIPLSLGIIDSVYSDTLKEARNFWVYVPHMNPETGVVATYKKYPVLYLLDGDGHFFSVASMIQQLSSPNSSSLIPEMVVVAIPNTDRTRDLTPTHVHTVFGDSSWSKTSGGAEAFTQFIRSELIPYVESKYPVSTYRTLVGHSLGGLYTVHTLANHPDLFANYLAIDPSMWWDDRKLSHATPSLFAPGSLSNKTLFVAVANTMETGMDIERIHTDTSGSSEHIRSILEFNKITESNTASGLGFEWKYYGDDDHGSVPLISEYDALRYFFRWYKMNTDDLYPDDPTLTADEVLARVSDHANLLSEKFGYEVPPDEGLINQLGYFYMGKNKGDDAYTLFKYNVDHFPASANVFDSIGDYWLWKGDTTKAIESFEQAMKVEPLDYTRNKLHKLKEGK